MKINKQFIFVCVIFCVQISNSFAQNLYVTDSASNYPALSNAVSILNSAIGNGSRLYNGPEYYFYNPLVKGNAYFMDVITFSSGAVYYDGVLYSGVPMLYDIYKDEVVVLLYNHFSKFSLLENKLSSFDFLGHHFINVNADTLVSNQVLRSGIYDQLYSGKSQVLAKRSKDIQTNTSSQTVESYFNARKTAYFIKIKKLFYTFSSQKSLLEVLKDHKKQLQQFIKSGNLKYRNSPEEVMVKITAYYDQLN